MSASYWARRQTGIARRRFLTTWTLAPILHARLPAQASLAPRTRQSLPEGSSRSPATWQVLSDTQFMNRLLNNDKDNIPPKVIKHVKTYYDDEEITPTVVERVSVAAKSLCMWCRAMKVYDEVAKVVEPKKLVLAESTAKLEMEQKKLKSVQEELAAVIAKVEELQATCDKTVAEKQQLQEAAAVSYTHLTLPTKA